MIEFKNGSPHIKVATAKVKVFVSDDERTNRCCGNCGNREHVAHGSSLCKIDGHRVGYLDCDFCWCRHWKRDRKFDRVIKA